MPEEPNKVPTNETPELTAVPSFDIEPATNASQPVESIVDTPFAQQPTVSPVQQPTVAPMGMPPKKSKKGIIIGSVIGGLVVLIGASSALAYNLWYQNPDKVMADAVGNILSGENTKGSSTVVLAMNGNGVEGELKIDAKSDDKIAMGAINLSLSMKEPAVTLKDIKLDVVASSDGDGYIKINDADKIIDQALTAYFEYMAKSTSQYGGAIDTPVQVADQKKAITDMLDPVVKRINNQWIKFPNEGDATEISKEQQCTTDAIKKFQSDKATSNELTKTYIDNKFVIVKEKLPVKDGSLGYVLDLDTTKAKSFGTALENTKFAAELKKCGDSSTLSTDTDSVSKNPFKDTRVEIRIDRWSHKITGVSMDAKLKDANGAPDTYSLKSTFDYKKVENLSAPKDATDYRDLQKEIEKMMSGGSTASSSSSLLSI